MPFFIVDTRDRVAQRVTNDAPIDSGQTRFVKVEAESAREAIGSIDFHACERDAGHCDIDIEDPGSCKVRHTCGKNAS